jgi:hypothetical protein
VLCGFAPNLIVADEILISRKAAKKTEPAVDGKGL